MIKFSCTRIWEAPSQHCNSCLDRRTKDTADSFVLKKAFKTANAISWRINLFALIFPLGLMLKKLKKEVKLRYKSRREINLNKPKVHFWLQNLGKTGGKHPY